MTIEITDEMRKQALVKFLDCEAEDVDEDRYGDNLFEAEGGEYLVLTDAEADEKTREYIEESVWAFNPDFLASHSEVADEEVFKMLATKCESANSAMAKLIKDFDHFVDDAIRGDGRGHFIAHYDGNENEESLEVEGEDGKKERIYFYIYRTN